MAFCLALPERAGVVAIPSQVFYDDHDEGRHKVRWAFCKDTGRSRRVYAGCSGGPARLTPARTVAGHQTGGPEGPDGGRTS